MSFDVEAELDKASKKGKAVSAPDLPPHITATFYGFYYKSGLRGNERAPFRETVRVPLSLVRHENRSAIGVFRDLIGPKVLQEKDGFNGVAFCQIGETSPLPEDLPVYKQLDWTGTQSGLAAIAKVHAKAVKVGLYVKPQDLRHNIRLCLQDEKAFIDMQDKRGGALAEDYAIAEELEALGYK